MTNPRRHSRPAFSLLEVAVVLLVIGILAISAAPSFSAAGNMRAAGVVGAVERQIVDARSRAMASGRPHGVRVDPTLMRLETVWIPAAGEEPRLIEGLTAALDLRELDQTARFASVSPGTGDGSLVFWFGFDGRPEGRGPTGTYVGPWASDGEIRMASGASVIIARSGAVHR